MSSKQEDPSGRHQEIEQFCSEYDYSEDVKAHGFAGMAAEASREDLQIMYDDMSDLFNGTP